MNFTILVGLSQILDITVGVANKESWPTAMSHTKIWPIQLSVITIGLVLVYLL